MEYRYCGESGLQLPVISLGLWHNFGNVDLFSTMQDIVLTAFDRGITHFDLANNYGPPPGAAEENFGRILSKGLLSHRDEIVVSSKAGHLMWDGPYGDGSSRKHLMASLDQSLRRTGLDYFDIFYSHRYNPETPYQETAQALIDMVRSGKVLYVGLSKYPVDVAQKMCDFMAAQHVRCLIYQDKYNLLVRDPEQKHIEWIKQQRVGFIAFSPLAQGLLTDRYLNGIPADSRAARSTGFLQRDAITPDLIDRLKKLNELAQGRGQTLAEMSLAWLISRQAVTSVIIGASSVSQLEKNLKATINTRFSTDELHEIDRILD